jgi:hypothetical protein
MEYIVNGSDSLNDFQMIGDLELPLVSDTGELIRSWMVEILSVLSLNARFLAKILESAQAAADEAIQAAAVQQAAFIHLLIFAPIKPSSSGQTWGFFRIKKMESPPADRQIQIFMNAFYLYLEGS